MTDPQGIFDCRAVFVIDVQKYLIEGPDAVPDALEVRQAIGGILRSLRQHNDLTGSSRNSKTKIIFVQHDDKDPHDPLYRGKPTWELEFSPRKYDDAEILVSKDVREFILSENGGAIFFSVEAHQNQATCSKAMNSLLKNFASKASLRSQLWVCNPSAACVRPFWGPSIPVSTLKALLSCRALIRHSTTPPQADPTHRSRKT
jgi:hypothetical protein